MSNNPSLSETLACKPGVRLSGSCRLLLLAVLLAPGPLLAADPSAMGAAARVAVTNPAITSISGGVGDEARVEMRSQAAAYNVHVVFSQRGGSYLADIPFTVTRIRGRNPGEEVHSGVSQGPLLYLKLPAGTYRIDATIDGVVHSRRIVALGGGPSVRLAFVGKGT